MKQYLVNVKIEDDTEGYFISCPALDGCFTHGVTLDEAIDNIKDVVELFIIDLLEDGQQIPLEEFVPGKKSHLTDSDPSTYKISVEIRKPVTV